MIMQASIDAIHDAGGEVLKLIGDGVLAMFTQKNMVEAKRAALRAGVPVAATSTTSLPAEARPVTTAYVGLHVGEVFYGNIGSEDRLDFTVVGPAVNEVSRIASMQLGRSGVADVIGLPRRARTTEANYLVSTGRFALRGISRAQDLYTLDPDVASDEVVSGEIRALSRELRREPTDSGWSADVRRCASRTQVGHRVRSEKRQTRKPLALEADLSARNRPAATVGHLAFGYILISAGRYGVYPMAEALFDQDAWLKRIGYSGPLEPTFSVLNDLVFRALACHCIRVAGHYKADA